MKKAFIACIMGFIMTGAVLGEAISDKTGLGQTNNTISMKTKTIEGCEMIPLREVAEKLGFELEWNGKDHTITLDDGKMNTTLTLGLDLYYASSSVAIGTTAPERFGVGPTMVNGQTYVPAEMFRALLGNAENAVSIAEGTATFIKRTAEEVGAQQITTPYTEHNSLKELANAVGFQFSIPEKLPEGYELSKLFDISNDTVDIRWKKGDAEISYRAAQGTEDISGDYTVYDSVVVDTISGSNVTLKGNNDKVYVATWQKGQMTYSITATEGLLKQEIENLINVAY